MSLLLSEIKIDELSELTAKKVVDQLKKIRTEPEKQEMYLTTKQVAKLMQISLPTLHLYSKQGLIPSYRLGRNIRYKSSEIQKIIEKGLRFCKGGHNE